MTREEQIEEFAKGYASLYVDDNYEAVKSGIEWADEHPKEGMVNIDDVCEWIEDHIWDYIETSSRGHSEMLGEVRFSLMFEDLKNNFKKE